METQQEQAIALSNSEAGENEPETAAPAAREEPVSDAAAPQHRNSENRHFAAARRKAEQEETLRRVTERAHTEAQTKYNEALRAGGLVAPDTHQPIDSLEALNAYVQRRSAVQTAGGEAGASSPEVHSAAAEAAHARVAEQMEEIRRLDPAIRQISDLQKNEAYPKIYELCKKGYSLSDAYKLANLDAIRAQTAAASRQAAINATAGKEHMVRTESRGAGLHAVPREIRESYLALNPNATDSEIAAHYNQYLSY